MRQRYKPMRWTTDASLSEAHRQAEAALRPWQPVMRQPTAEDLLVADEHLKVWENATSMSYTLVGPHMCLVDAMLDLLKDVVLLPETLDFDVAALRMRALALQCKIRKTVLLTSRDEYKQLVLKELDGTPQDDAQITEDADIRMLSAWASDIDENILQKQCHPEDRILDPLPHIFANLETFSKIVPLPIEALNKSDIISVLKRLASAPTIPPSSYKPGIRNLAKSLAVSLSHKTRNPVDPDSIDVGSDPEPDHMSFPLESWKNTGFVHRRRLDEVNAALQRLQLAASVGDTEIVIHTLQEIERWGPPEDSNITVVIAPSVAKASHLLTELAKSKPISVSGAVDYADRLSSDLYKYTRPTGHPRMVVGRSYYLGAPRQSGNTPARQIKVVFKDIGSTRLPEENRRLGNYMSHTDFSVWDPVTIMLPLQNHTCDLGMEPMDAFLEAFIASSNALNRHPLSPLHHFHYTLEKEFLTSSGQGVELRAQKVWETRVGWFVQGRVSDYLGKILNNEKDEIIVWFKRRDGTGTIGLQTQGISMSPVYSRSLPPSCYPPPSHWIEPTPPPISDGPIWRQIPVMQFIGNGSDLHHNVKWPPVICKHVYAPISVEAMGLHRWESIRRVPISLDVAPVKLRPPLTLEQARSLLGQTVLYELPDEPAQGSARNRTKRKREDIPQWSPYFHNPKTTNNHVFCAFVWGLDPDRLVITLFEQDDTYRTFWLGTEEPTDLTHRILPHDYPPERKVTRPRWIGGVRITPPVSPPSGEEATLAVASDGNKKSRWSEILGAAPRTFEVGIGGNDTIVVGELQIQGLEGGDHIAGCKPGIWESGYPDGDDEPDGSFCMWVQWIKSGTINLKQPVSAFGSKSKKSKRLPKKLEWTKIGSASVDGGSVGIIAKGYLSKDSRRALVGDKKMGDDDDEELLSFIEMAMLSGWEDGHAHIPGGISMNTGGDGEFPIYASYDTNGKIVALEVTELEDENMKE